MPMCTAMLQNQAKNMTCQKVNFTCPGSGSPPFQITVCAACQKSPGEVTPNWRNPTTPKATKTSTIQGTATLANWATNLYPYAATTEISKPTTAALTTQPTLL